MVFLKCNFLTIVTQNVFTCVQDIHTYHCGGFGQEIRGTLASYIDTFYFTENPLKIIEKITEKGVATDPLVPP